MIVSARAFALVCLVVTLARHSGSEASTSTTGPTVTTTTSSRSSSQRTCRCAFSTRPAVNRVGSSSSRSRRARSTCTAWTPRRRRTFLHGRLRRDDSGLPVVTGYYGNGGGRAKLQHVGVSPGLLPESSEIKIGRDEDRLRRRREREVARAVAGASWSGRAGHRANGSAKSSRKPYGMVMGHDGTENNNNNNNSSRSRRTNGDADSTTSASRMRRKKASGAKRLQSDRSPYNRRRKDESIISSFSAVDNVEQLSTMVDDLICKLENSSGSSSSASRLISPREVTSLIRLLGARGAYDAMLKFLRHPASRPNVFSYTAACASLAQSSNPTYRSQSASLLDEMDRMGIQPSTYTFTAIMLGVDGGADAMKMMEKARQYGDSVDMNVFIFNSAIHACSRNPPSTSKTDRNKMSADGQNEGWQTALLLFRQMKKENIVPNEQTYASLLHACGKSGQVKLALSFLNEMKTNPSTRDPDEKVWGAILQVLASAGDYKKAMKIMREMVLMSGISPNILHCNALLASLSRARKDDVALDLLDCMLNGTVPVFISANATVPVDDIRMARPDLISINTVLAACSRCKNYRDAKIILQRMKNKEFLGDNKIPIKPDSITYNTILSACPNPEAAATILDEMRLSRRERYSSVVPTTVTYTNAITVCRRAEPPDLLRARQFLENAIREGVAPNVFMYSAAIWTAERCSDPDAALAFLHEMKSSTPSRHCKPNAVTYDGCVSAFASKGKYKEVMQLLQEMKDLGIAWTPVTYKRIAIAISKSDLSDAEVPSVLEPIVYGMKKADRSASCSGPLLATLIRAYGSCGLYNKAKKVFRLIRGPTDEACLSAMLYACAKKTKWQDALFFLHTSDIVADALGPGRIDSVALTYASIACARANQWKEALNVIELYGRFGENGDKAIVSVNAVNSLISACGRSGRADMAVKLLNEMPVRFQVVPDSQSYRFAIIACNQAEQRRQRGKKKGIASVANDALQWWEVALSLLRRMQEDGLMPDAQIYSSVISACESSGQWQRALGVLRSMSVTTGGEIPTPPNLYCVNAAISACEKGGAWLEAVELYERIKSSSRKIRPNFVTVNSLLIALEAAGQREMSESIYKEAIRDDVLSPWKYRKGSDGQRIRAIDLHQFSQPLAKVAVRTALESVLGTRPQFDVTSDLVIIVGKGNRSEDGTPTLRPVVQELLEEMGIPSSVPDGNTGRIIIKSIDLIEFSKRMSWLGDDEKG